MDREAPCANCNVCGGSHFTPGPGDRLSITNRLPHCAGCHSLERHRVARYIFDGLRPAFTKGTRLLQFSADPGVAKEWFSELTVSVWQGPNSLDMQAIALPDGRYDWIYSSHVLNHISDEAAALREMLRVVGPQGVVAISVGGTVFNYATKASTSFCGRDRQFRVYGTEFATELQRLLPEVSVLELVAADPCTASIDSFYLYSRATTKLREMATLAVARNVHARVLPAKVTTTEALAEAAAPTPLDETPLAPCNICGATRFTFGPSNRRSAPHGQLPCCSGCHSLERHRIMRHVFDSLAPTFTRGKRLLQFDNNPGLLEEWFDETLVAARVGGNATDLGLAKLPDGSYDWVCGMHIVGDAPEARAPLAELLRVAGPQGIVALSLRGSAGRFESLLSLRSEDDLIAAREDHGNEFVDDIQERLPNLAALEFVTSDPSTATVDAVYVCSYDPARLEQLAKCGSDLGIYPRFFPASRQKVPPRAASAADWDRLRREIDAWQADGHRARFWIRDDDASKYSVGLAALVELCAAEAVPLALAVIPERATHDFADEISRRSGIMILQHGYDHRNRSTTKLSSEFPDERPIQEAIDAVRAGLNSLYQRFGDAVVPVFVPPWGTCSDAVRRRLREVGLIGFSGSQVGPFRPIESCRRGAPRSSEGLSLASTHIALNRAKANDTSVLPKLRHLTFLSRLVQAIRTGSADQDEPVGVMTHAWGVDAAVRDFLGELVQVTRAAGAEWVGAGDLFTGD
jgi:hypothetical protein